MTLCKKMEKNTLGVIVYSSKKLTDAQKAYSNFKREMLALVLRVEKYEKYFAVAATKIYAYTDHETILLFLTARHLPASFVRWINRVLKHIVVRHLKGRESYIGYLSRIKEVYDLPEYYIGSPLMQDI